MLRLASLVPFSSRLQPFQVSVLTRSGYAWYLPLPLESGHTHIRDTARRDGKPRLDRHGPGRSRIGYSSRIKRIRLVAMFATPLLPRLRGSPQCNVMEPVYAGYENNNQGLEVINNFYNSQNLEQAALLNGFMYTVPLSGQFNADRHWGGKDACCCD